jgi:anaerobic selenocysteine-containing dehydrogenase
MSPTKTRIAGLRLMSQMSKAERKKPVASAQAPKNDGAPPWRLARREFLKIFGAGTAAAAVSACTIPGLGTVPAVGPDDSFPEPGPESFTPTLCGLCPGGCGALVRKIGDRAVKLEGNPLHPVNRGKLCPVGQASLQLLYNPDRLRAPLRRVGERGSGAWRQISWREAIELMRSNLAELRVAAAPHKLMVLSGGKSEIADRLMQRFLEAYGSPNFIRQDGAESYSGQDLSQGISGRVAYDLENANYILSFGAPLAEGWMSPVRQMRALAWFHQGRPGRRGKLVQIESRLSATAAKADEWIPLRPGTEGILALGLAHIMVRQGLYDKFFVEKFVAGFEGPVPGNEQGFRDMVLAGYAPDRVSALTGVPAMVIERIAREFVHFGPSVALPPDALVPRERSRRLAAAVQALNALAGSIDKPGGVLVREDPPLSPWPPVKQDPVAARGVREAGFASLPSGSLAAAILEGRPSEVSTLFVLGANPVFAGLTGFREAAMKVPFVVSFASLLDESAAQADLVLPDCTPLERCDIQTAIPGFALTTVGIGNPAVAPLYDSKPAAAAILELARALGGSVAESLPWPSATDAVKDLIAGLRTSKHGIIFADKFREEYLVPALRKWEWPAQEIPSGEDFWNKLVARGGWVDPRYHYEDYERTLKTRSGKFELYALLGAAAVSAEAENEDRDARFPFRLHLFRSLALTNDASANLPFLQEIAGSPRPSPWDSSVELNPRTAQRLGIQDGELIFVVFPNGKLMARARMFEGTMPDVVNIPVGQGHSFLGRWAKDRGVNPISLIRDDGPTRVRIERM